MKARLFSSHKVRTETAVGPIWNFYTLNEKEEKVKEYKMLVPAAWESHPDLVSYRGKALYSKKIRTGGNARFNFKGVSHTCRVYLDNKLIGEHYNAYTEFSIIVKRLAEADHLLEVIVDNSFHEESALHVENDYYSYGGITRPFIVEKLADAYIKNIKFAPRKKDGKWFGKVTAAVENLADKEITADLNLVLGANNFTFKDCVIEAGTTSVLEDDFEFIGVDDYMPNSPALYFLEATLISGGSTIDDYIDRVGFREVRVEGADLLFNGQKLIIKGFNRHEDYGTFGCAVPVAAMYRDIELIKSMGANCVRTCHYPNDERFLDMCDENGLVVWEEAHARGLSEKQMKHKNFDRQSEDCIREMIDSHFNHPSIFVWGILNECVSNTEFGRGCYKKQIELIKKTDPSRPVSFAALEAFIGSDKCLDLVDIVSWNIYPKWYHDTPVEESCRKLIDFIEGTEGAGKPILISEIGAGGIYGYRSNNFDKWTEEYQAKAIREQITAVLENKRLSGVILWQYADCRVTKNWFHFRPKNQNNKGVVDAYRREKLACQVVRELYWDEGRI